MSSATILTTLLILSSIAYYLGRRRAFAVAGRAGGIKYLHSRPTYYGALTALWCGIPALLLFSLWLAFDDKIITNLVVSGLPQAIRGLPENRLNLVVNDIKNLVSGNIVAGEVTATIQAAAAHYGNLKASSNAALAVGMLSLGIVGTAVVRSRISPTLRARNLVEQLVKYLLIACSCLAILTTIGIVLSVLFEAIRFFKAVPLTEFLFGLQWSPQMAIRRHVFNFSYVSNRKTVFKIISVSNPLPVFNQTIVSKMCAVFNFQNVSKSRFVFNCSSVSKFTIVFNMYTVSKPISVFNGNSVLLFPIKRLYNVRMAHNSSGVRF